jgi:hypothetical protein
MRPRKMKGVHMHKLKTFATALIMSSVFVVMFWAQFGMMATNAAGAPRKGEPAGIVSNPYQDIALTYGPSFAEFASLAR